MQTIGPSLHITNYNIAEAAPTLQLNRQCLQAIAVPESYTCLNLHDVLTYSCPFAMRMYKPEGSKRAARCSKLARKAARKQGSKDLQPAQNQLRRPLQNAARDGHCIWLSSR